MNEPMMLTFLILAVTIVVFISDKLRVDIVALLALLALVLSGIIDTAQALAGFSDSTVVMIAALFVVGGGLFRTGVADWLGDRLLQWAGSRPTRLMVVLMAGTAFLSAFLSNTGTMAILIPVVVAAAWRINYSPAKLLLPIAFAASMGGLLTLVGTPPNIIIANTLVDANLRPFGFFEFSLIGLPLLVIGILYMLFGQRWLPERPAHRAEPAPDASLAEQLAETYQLERNLVRVRVRRGSPLIGLTLEQANLGGDYGVNVLRVERTGSTEEGPFGTGARARLETIAGSIGLHPPDLAALSPGPDTIIQADDRLLVEGESEAVARMAFEYKLGIRPRQPDEQRPEQELLSQEIGLAEALIAPRSALIGQTIVEANFAEKYGVRVLRILRRGALLKDRPLTRVKLEFGDALLVRGTWQAIGLLENERRNFVVVGRPAALARSTGLHPRAVIAMAALLGMLVLMLTGLVTTVMAVLIAGMVMILGGCLNIEQAYRAINWESVVLIAAMLPMSTALEVTGGAAFIAQGLVTTLGSLHPLVLMAGIFILTAGFTQVISNTATTVLVAPIALQAAVDLGVSPYPVLMIVAAGASAAFLTPIASPVNTLVLTPGGYRFGDFMRVGLPLLLIFGLASVLLAPLVWGL